VAGGRRADRPVGEHAVRLVAEGRQARRRGGRDRPPGGRAGGACLHPREPGQRTDAGAPGGAGRHRSARTGPGRPWGHRNSCPDARPTPIGIKSDISDQIREKKRLVRPFRAGLRGRQPAGRGWRSDRTIVRRSGILPVWPEGCAGSGRPDDGRAGRPLLRRPGRVSCPGSTELFAIGSPVVTGGRHWKWQPQKRPGRQFGESAHTGSAWRLVLKPFSRPTRQPDACLTGAARCGAPLRVRFADREAVAELQPRASTGGPLGCAARVRPVRGSSRLSRRIFVPVRIPTSDSTTGAKSGARRRHRFPAAS
jgi:hypothetical protein